jgi:outer membrane protease
MTTLVALATGTEEIRLWTDETKTVPYADRDEIGKYADNNRVVAYVDRQGLYYVGHKSDALIERLEKAGYERGSITVPHSNDSGKWMREHFPERAHTQLTVE